MRYFMSYLDAEFLEDFFKQKPTNVESDGEELEIWRHWLRFIRDKSDIDLTVTVDSTDLSYNINTAFTRELIDGYLQGKEHISINSKKLDSVTARDLVVNSEKPTFIFRNKLQNAEITEEKTGFCCIDGTSFFEKWQHYFKAKSYAISKSTVPNQLEKWSDLFLDYRYPSNAFVIVDNYIFNYKPNINNNLLKIIKEILQSSKNVKTEIDLIIVSEHFYKENGENEVSIDKLHNEIIRYLRNFSILNVNLCLVKAKYHDRLILSNYFVMDSGNSFNYFGSDGSTVLNQNTHLSLTPLTSDYSKINAYKNELSDIIEQSQEYKGTKKNRLLKSLLT